jgi:hypothetical protein
MGFMNWMFGTDDAARARDALNRRNFQLQGGDMLRGYAQGQLGGVQGRMAPTARGSQLAGGPQDQARAGQMGLAGQLSAVASGQQAGAGELAVNRQANQAAARQFAAQNMARGGNAATAARSAANQLGDLGTNASGMAQQAALSDQAAARGQLAGVYDSMRGQDIGFAGQNANLAQQMAMANQQAALQQRGMNDQYGLGLMGQYNQMDQQELQARLARAGLAQQANRGGMFGDLLQMGGTLGAAALTSDRAAKVQVADASLEVDDALRALTPYRYSYADPEKDGAGSRVGIMAQDLAATPAGADILVDAPGVLALDPMRALTFALAAVARLSARVEALESALGGSSGPNREEV